MADRTPTPTGRPLLVAVGSVGLWALLLVVSRVVLVRTEIDPWSFAFVQLIAGGAVLIILSTGGGPVDWSSLRRIQTWIYGTLRVTTAAAFTAALVHIPVTQAGMLGSVKVVFGVIGTRLAFGRKPSRLEYGGHLAILSGITLVLTTRLDGGIRNPAVLLMLVSELAVVTSSLVAEAHPDNSSDDPTVRRRFSGTVLLLTAALFLVFRVLQQGVDWRSASFGIEWGVTVWLGGLIVGVALRGPAIHTSLNAIRLVGAEVYLMVASSLALVGLVFETIAASLDLIEPTAYGAADFGLIGVIAGGAIWVFSARRSGHHSVRDASP